MMHSTLATGAYVGWWKAPRPFAAWTRLAAADTRDDCVAALMDALAHIKNGAGDWQVLPAGVHPERREAVVRRRRF
jgi:hypothetical protein